MEKEDEVDWGERERESKYFVLSEIWVVNTNIKSHLSFSIYFT